MQKLLKRHVEFDKIVTKYCNCTSDHMHFTIAHFTESQQNHHSTHKNITTNIHIIIN